MVVRKQLGPGMGDQAIVALNNEKMDQDIFHGEYAQYAKYANYNVLNMHDMNAWQYA